MKSPPFFFMMLMLAIVLGALAVWGVASTPAWPDEWGSNGDPARKQFFNDLMGTHPDGTKFSCCNESDCKRTEARQLADGRWEALVPFFEGPRWVVIPEEKILPNKSIDGEAYVCSSSPVTGGMYGMPMMPTDPAIYCFVKPIPGY